MHIGQKVIEIWQISHALLAANLTRWKDAGNRAIFDRDTPQDRITNGCQALMTELTQTIYVAVRIRRAYYI
jgi:hypothetical protein